jgi:hypothetical protein
MQHKNRSTQKVKTSLLKAALNDLQIQRDFGTSNERRIQFLSLCDSKHYFNLLILIAIYFDIILDRINWAPIEINFLNFQKAHISRVIKFGFKVLTKLIVVYPNKQLLVHIIISTFN